ncbi:MAG: hypothetical protein R3E39_09570 [Anaerolineae bacterium]
MPTAWNCLFLPLADAASVITAAQDSLTQLGYTLYNPFGLMPGKSYARTVRLFVAPSRAGWVKIIGEFDERQLSQISQIAPCLYATLQGKVSNIRIFHDKHPAEPEIVFETHLKTGFSAAHIQDAMQEKYPKIIPNDLPESGLPFDALPDNVKAMADKVNPGQAQKMFARLTGDVLKKVGSVGDQADAARALVNNQDAPDWNSAGGLKIQALINCLTIPANWRDPDFNTLRDAYQLHARRQRNPNARAYPGDDDVMAQVPDALDYTPVFGGQD